MPQYFQPFLGKWCLKRFWKCYLSICYCVKVQTNNSQPTLPWAYDWNKLESEDLYAKVSAFLVKCFIIVGVFFSSKDLFLMPKCFLIIFNYLCLKKGKTLYLHKPEPPLAKKNTFSQLKLKLKIASTTTNYEALNFRPTSMRLVWRIRHM